MSGCFHFIGLLYNIDFCFYSWKERRFRKWQEILQLVSIDVNILVVLLVSDRCLEKVANHSKLKLQITLSYIPFFFSKPQHGLMVRPSRVTCRGINCAKLINEMESGILA